MNLIGRSFLVGSLGKLKMKGFRGFSLNISKNDSTDFHQICHLFWQLSIESFEIERLKTGHSFLPW